ncbi:hypothetical protein GMSM_10060 [Geomonas sp. Red276]
MTLVLERKTGRIPKGRYTFVECYCTDPGCDCRRTTIFVINDKSKPKAVISFGFDPDEPLAGPFLDDVNEQAPYADELLDSFVEAINGTPEWLSQMYAQYRSVRKKVDGKTYRGKPFPKPGSIKRSPVPPPALDFDIQRMREALAPSPGPSRPVGRDKQKVPRQVELFDDLLDGSTPDSAEKESAAGLLERYLAGRHGAYAEGDRIQNDLHRYLQTCREAGDELARLLVASFQDERRGEAALRLVFDTLEILRVDLERHRPDSRRRMESLQEALARRVFLEQEDADLCASVTDLLRQSRVEILPVVHQANTRRMMEGADETDFSSVSPEEVHAGLFKIIEEASGSSPFEGVEALLNLFGLGEAGVQISLAGEMITAPRPLIREVGALMLFHPSPEVRRGVSGVLAGCDGESLSPEILRRLILSRNWFPDEVKKNLDLAIGNARRARVECAPLPRTPSSLKVYASAVDGAGAQSFQAIVADGKGFSSCSILLKDGVGVADAFVMPLPTKRALNDFLALMKDEAGGLESTVEYLDLRLNHALADGMRQGNAPSHWLVRIAELLGRNQWMAAHLDPRRELAALRKELASSASGLLTPREVRESLEDSADWPRFEVFASSWFEDDAEADGEIEAARQNRKKEIDPWLAIGGILNNLLEKRRTRWLQRLVATALWLKSARKAPVPWHQVFHVAEAVANDALPLKEIPLMLSVAELSLTAYMGRQSQRR